MFIVKYNIVRVFDIVCVFNWRCEELMKYMVIGKIFEIFGFLLLIDIG